MTSQYPKDEFDLAGDDMPVGMHRPEPSRWRNVFPFLVILLAVPVLAWAFSSLLTSNTTASQSGSQAAVSSASTQSVAQTAQSEPEQQTPVEPAQSEPAPEPEPEPEQKPEESLSAQVNYNVAVEVLNGTNIQGLAAEKVNQLKQAGFPGASAANAVGWGTEISTIYYRDQQVEVTAKEIGRQLGIENLSLEPNLDSNADMVIVLK